MFNKARKKYLSVLFNLKYWGVNPRRLISNNVMSRLGDRSHPGIFCLKHFHTGKRQVLRRGKDQLSTDSIDRFSTWIYAVRKQVKIINKTLKSCFLFRIDLFVFYCKSSMKYWSQCSQFGWWEFRNVSPNSPGSGNETSWKKLWRVCDHQQTGAHGNCFFLIINVYFLL